MQLPTGYQDSASAFFVPEDLRAHYEKLPQVPTKEHHKILEKYAKAKATELTTPSSSVEEYWSKYEQIMSTADFAEVLHSHYIYEAARRFHLFTKRTQEHEIRRKGSICPVCGEVTLDTPSNPLATRSLQFDPTAIGKRPHDLHSCIRCYLTALQIKTEEAQTEKIGRKTRREIVAKALGK